MKITKSMIYFLVLVAGMLPVSGRADLGLDARAGYSKLLMHQRHTIPIQISVRAGMQDEKARAPVNVAIILDRSGSMSGEKIEHAKDSAIMALNMLGAEDIVSVITYDSSADVVVPATKVSDRAKLTSLIRAISPRGNTALFAGVSKGASELRKFFDKNRVNRVVLLSDGLANVGPSSPGELGELGRSLAREGITVSTFGLGADYNEDLMTELAQSSEGNHAFVERYADLERIFRNEFGDLLSVVAQDVMVTITCPVGVRPIRLLGRKGDILGQRIVVPLNQLYSEQEKFVVLEAEIDPQFLDYGNLARIQLTYLRPGSNQQRNSSTSVVVAAASDPADMERSADKKALEVYYAQLTNDLGARAIALRDAGKKEEAQELLSTNVGILKDNSLRYEIPNLDKLAQDYEKQKGEMDTRDWILQRKSLREYGYKNSQQQKW